MIWALIMNELMNVMIKKTIVKTTILSFFLCISVAANAQTPSMLEKKWNSVMNAIEQVESKGNCKAVSADGQFVGCMQISKILVRQCNIIKGSQYFTYNDRYSRAKSREMFVVFQEHFNPEGNTEKAIRLWNSGDLKCMQRKASTDGYYRRVMAKYDQMALNN